MSVQMSSFANAIKRKFNDYSPYIDALIYEFTNDRIRELEDKYNSPNLFVSHTFSPNITTGAKDLSTYSPEDFRTSGITKIVSNGSNLVLQRMSLNRYLELGQSASNNIAENAKQWVPIGATDFILNPIPSSSSTYTIYGYKRHPFMSADAQYFHFSDDETDVVKNGVIADIYEDRDDTRYAIWEKKMQDGIKDKQRKQKMAEGQNIRLLPGDSIE